MVSTGMKAKKRSLCTLAAVSSTAVELQPTIIWGPFSSAEELPTKRQKPTAADQRNVSEENWKNRLTQSTGKYMQMAT